MSFVTSRFSDELSGESHSGAPFGGPSQALDLPPESLRAAAYGRGDNSACLTTLRVFSTLTRALGAPARVLVTRSQA